MLSFINTKEKYLFAASAVLSSFSSLFFLIGVCSYADDEDTVQNIPWGEGEDSFGPFDREVYLGLQGGLSINNGGDPYWSLYSDCSATSCDTCKTSGVVSMVFCLFALILSLATAGLNIKMVLLMGKSRIAIISGIVCSVFASLFSCVAVVAFIPCLKDSEDATNVDMYFGAAGRLAISGMFFMFLSAILVSCSCCIGGNDEDGLTAEVRDDK